ncbi:CBS domain-containing protein [Streptomyces griseorubiginosus]|uniref:CBS domain-containing protein n=1 Tax=Streptomyces griseorubiginosus TaxID=67304 RepID=UPI0033F8CB76
MTQHVSDSMTSAPVTVEPQTSVTAVARIMREHAVRRIPVVEGGHPVGIVAPGDAAMERDPESALGDISVARPNT